LETLKPWKHVIITDIVKEETKRTMLSSLNHSTRAWLIILALGLLLAWLVHAPLVASGWADYLPLHISLEVFSLAIGSMIFAVAWSTQSYVSTVRLLILGVCALGVSVLDLLHMLSFKGMPDVVTPSDPEKAINFWLIARSLLAVGLLAAAWIPHRLDSWLAARSKYVWLAISLSISLIAAIWFLWLPEAFPRTFIEGVGLTTFKRAYEYVLMALFLLAALGFYLHTAHSCELNPGNLLAASVVFAMSEFLFTLYGDVTDIYNVLGHVYKIVGFVFLYRAVFLQVIKQPFHQLQDAKTRLQSTLDTLPDILLEIRANGTILKIHSGHDKITNLHLFKPGENLVDLLPHSNIKDGLKALESAAILGVVRNIDFNVPSSQGCRHFDLSISCKPSEGEPTFLVLAREITEQVQQKQRLALESRINALLLHLEQSEQAREERVFLQMTIDGLRDILASQVAFLYQYDPTGRIEHSTVSIHDSQSQKALTVELPLRVSELLKPRLVNDLPEHALHLDSQSQISVRRFVSVPVIESDQLKAILAVANKPSPYSELDLQAMERVAEFLWRGIKLHRQESAITQLSTALGQSPYPVMITDTSARILYVNEAFSRVSGYGPLEIIGKTPHVMKSGLTPPEVYDEMWEKISSGQTWQGELINRKKDGTVYTEKAMIYPVRNSAGEITNYVAHKEDITLQREVEKRIHQLANYDQLTGLANREVLEERLKQLVERGSESELPVTVLWLDLDNFKAINDTLGHEAGNLLLVKVSNRLRHELGEHVMLSRVSGDGFVALLTHTDQHAAALQARQLLDALQKPVNLYDRQIAIGASIGMSIFPGDADTVTGLLMNAETAMYRVKMEGRNGLRFYSHDMQEHSLRALEIASALKQADMDKEFHMVYQPQISLEDNSFVGAEALIRWNHPVWGTVSPGEFIPIAEQSGHILEIGRWVLKHVTQQIRLWRDRGLGDFSVAVNLSALQFVQGDMVKNIIETVARANIPPGCIEVELTESVALNNPLAAGQAISALRRAGFSVSIDDFGTGYSSMGYLKRFAVDKIKIDQSFIRELATSEDDKAIVSAIVQMAHSLGMKTIAEGVETAQQLEILKTKGCDQVQGYFFSRPLKADDFERFVRYYQQMTA